MGSFFHGGIGTISAYSLRAEDCGFASIDTANGSSFDLFNCVAGVDVGYQNEARFEHCTFPAIPAIPAGQSKRGHSIYYSSVSEFEHCVLSGGNYLFFVKGGGGRECLIKRSVVYAPQHFLGVTQPAKPGAPGKIETFDQRDSERKYGFKVTGCILEDPQFILEHPLDYRLQESSPAFRKTREGRSYGANLDEDGWPVPFGE